MTTPGSSLVGMLRARAEQAPEKLSYTYLASSGAVERELTCGGLDREARAIAVALQAFAAPGDRALMIYPPGMEFISGFFGCLYGGLIAVPAYPPDPTRLQRSLPRLLAIIKDARPTVVLTTRAIAAMAEGLFPMAPQLRALHWIATDAVELEQSSAWRDPEADAATLAFFQYTSGSTGVPKGVMITHGNLLHNQGLIRRFFRQDESTVVVGWLPLYHDMGLIGSVLQPLYVGGSCVLMSPLAFLKHPLRWLEAITRYRGTTSTAPNFGYDLCVRKVRPENLASLDLSSWKQALNGAEPVRADTLARFAETFAPCGFDRRAFFPCYGLAEATLVVTGQRAGDELTVRRVEASALERHELCDAANDAPTVRALVACGDVDPEQEVRIVEPESRVPCAPDQIGEIWVRGPSVAQGYWNRPEETEETFGGRLAGSGEGPYLRTGDLGFLHDGALYVTGRVKDLIIVRGQNYYPSDVEWAAEGAHAALRPGSSAAFALDTGAEEQVVLVAEVDRRFDPSEGGTLATDDVAEAVRQAVSARCGLHLATVVLIKAGALPKTSSGKLQRRACRAALLAGELEPLGTSSAAAKGSAPDLSSFVPAPAAGAVSSDDRASS
ncbi:MAG: fatty acyl-AMP ligase [Deltaproteobacteria bacterium]|nr:fatty acyl-AMP ligase [Deltaproteobacteria bacterium]